MNYLKYITIVLFCLLLAHCKSSQQNEKSNLIPSPETYSGTKDSTNTADLNWRQFFSDSTLIALIDTALKNNLDVLMTLQKIEVAKAQANLSKSSLFPSLGANIGVAQRKFGLYTMDGAGNITTEISPGQLVPIHLPDYYVGLQTSWEVDVWGKLRNKKKAALARYVGSLEGKNLLVSNLIAEISHSYYELIALDTELDIVQESIQLQENALNILMVQKSVGAANELAVKQFEAQVLDAQITTLEISQQILENENKINFLLGRYPQTVKRDKSLFLKDVTKPIQSGIPSQLLSNRPDIKQAEFELMASRADVKAAKAAFYPALNISGSLGYQAFNASYLFTSPQSLAYGLLGNLTAPLINRAAIKADFRSAKANQLEALYNYQKSIINAYVEVYNEILKIKNLEKIAELKNKQVNVLSQSIETSSELFKTGRANYLEVLLSQGNALEAKLEWVDVKKRQLITSVDIYKALGGGWK